MNFKNKLLKNLIRIGLFSILIFINNSIIAQKSFVLKFKPEMDHLPITPGTNYYLKSIADSVTIETFRFYVSNIVFIKNQKTVYTVKNKFFLMDIEEKLEIQLSALPKFEADAVQFNLGIDSLTNVSGALGGDLDPTKGMYWAWQSGYINFKLEGSSNSCKTRNHKYQFHIGGYSFPYNTLQQITLQLKNTPSAEISIDIEKFLTDVDLSKNNEVMSPNSKAVQLATFYKSIFKIR